MNQTQKKILAYLEKETIAFIEGNNHLCNTNAISDHLYLSRSSTSQYLNNMAADGSLIKIKEHPVIFLNRETLESTYDCHLDQCIFEDTDIFFDYFKKLSEKAKNFAKLIGFDTSLRYCVIQCQAAVKYPPHGLPVLLYGEVGTGKKRLARLMYEYAVDEGVLNKQDSFYIFQCKPNIDHEKLLFGYFHKGQPVEGILHKIEKGFLLFDHCENLSEPAKEKLWQYMQSENSFLTPSGNPIRKDIRLIFSTVLKKHDWINDELFQRIPVTINIPNLKDRFPEDRKKMIYSFIREEEKIMNAEVFISKTLLQTLLNADMPGNVEQLRSIIRLCCANALQSNDLKDGKICLYQYHLPNDALSLQYYDFSFSETNRLIALDALNVETEIQEIFFYYDKMISLYQKNVLEEHSDHFYQNCIDLMNDYFDHLVFSRKYTNQRISSIEVVLMEPLEILAKQYHLALHTNYAYILARIIYLEIYYAAQLSKWEEEHPLIHELNAMLTKDYAAESGIIKELSFLIVQTLDVSLDHINMTFLILDMFFFNKNPKNKLITGFILSHGYSTASSIADASNRLLSKHIYEALDMPLDITVVEIANKLSRYFINNYVGNEVILLVDMGSLEKIGDLLNDIPNMNIGIINNISTKVALDIGEKIIQGWPMKEILETTCKETSLHYQIISRNKKEYAIVFTTEMGIPSTDRMIQLFKSSMPNKKEITIVPYDYYTLSQQKEHDDLFKKYDILFITGTLKIEIPNIPFVALEDIINLNDIDIINRLMTNIYTEEEISVFNSNLMRNFSMYNVLNYITILNPDRLFTFVEKAVHQLETKLNTHFSNRIRIGMYIHISCLIERLVTKTAITSYEDIKGFEEEHDFFIQQVKDSFAEITQHYSIEIPTTEIAYLYAYIKNI